MSDMNLYVQLDLRKTSHVYPKYTIEPSTEPYQKCPNFEYVTQRITYVHPFDKSYVFRTYISKTNGDENVEYTPKGPWNNIVMVECIYSYLHPDKPLIVGLKATADSCQHIYYLYRDLAEKFKENCGLLPDSDISEENIVNKLFEELGRLTNNTKIGLDRDLTTLHIRDERSLGKKFTKVIYLGKVGAEEEKKGHYSTISYSDLTGSKILDTLNLKVALDNISTYYYDGIIVYENNTNESKESNQIPLMLEFYSKSERWQYVRKDIDGNYWEEELVKYRDEEELISALERISGESESKLTYIIRRLRGGYSSKIKFREEVVNELKYEEYIIHTHEPEKEVISNRAHIPYKKGLFKVIPNYQIRKENRLDNVQDQHYISIVTYVMTKDLGKILLVKFTTNEPKRDYYYYRYDMEASGWKQIEEGMGNIGRRQVSEILKDQEKTILLLLHIDYMMRSSIVIQVDVRDHSKYVVKLIKNSEEDIGKSIEDPRRHEVEVVKYGVLPSSRYIYYYQMIKEMSEVGNPNEIAGIRLCDRKDREVIMYDSSGTNREYIYLTESSSERIISTFFYYNEELPTVFCLGEVGYRVDHRNLMNEDGTSRIRSAIDETTSIKLAMNGTSGLRSTIDEADEKEGSNTARTKEFKGVTDITNSSTNEENKDVDAVNGVSAGGDNRKEAEPREDNRKEVVAKEALGVSRRVNVKWLRIDKTEKGDGCINQIHYELYKWDLKNRNYDPDMAKILAENGPNGESYGRKITTGDLESSGKERGDKASGRGQDEPETYGYLYSAGQSEVTGGGDGSKNSCHKGMIMAFVIVIILASVGIVHKSFKLYKMCRGNVGKIKLY